MQKKYDLFLSDPPWEVYKGGKRSSRPRQGRELDYPVLPVERIKDIHSAFQSLGQENHLFFMWVPDKYLQQGEQLMEQLGYRLHARMVWNKLNGIAPAFSLRYSHEYLLFMYYGKFSPVAPSARGKYMTVFEEYRRRHSQKPDISYAIIEDLYPDARRLELFARYTRPGWDCWGEEIPNRMGISTSQIISIH